MTALVAALVALALAVRPEQAPPPADLTPRPALRPLSEQDRRLREAALRQAATQTLGRPTETRERRKVRGQSALLVAGGLAVLGTFALASSMRERDALGAGLGRLTAYASWAFAGGTGLYGGWLLATDPPGAPSPPP
mgnify:CR=1 FL=1